MSEPLITEAEQILVQSQKPQTSLLQQIAHFSTAELPSDSAVVDASQIRITPTQRSMVALMVRGFSLSAACRQLSINYSAAIRWKAQSWFEAVAEEERTKWLINAGIDKRIELFAPLIGKSLETLRELMGSEDDKVRQNAVEYVLSNFLDDRPRLGRPPKPKEEVEAPLDLSALREKAALRIAQNSAAIRGNGSSASDSVTVIANG